MADWSLYGDAQQLTAGTDNTSAGITVTPGSNTKGSYVEILSSSASVKPATGFFLCINRLADASWDSLIDIAIGAAGSEQVIVSNLLSSLTLQGDGTSSVFYPIALPASTRVAARAAAGSAGSTQAIMLHLVHGGARFFPGLAGATGLGTNAADSGGTGITAGSGSKSAYVQIVASTERHYKGFSLRVGTQNSLISTANMLVDVAIGAAGSEQIIAPNIQIKTNGGASLGTGFIPLDIPAGSRIAVRAAGSTNRTFDLSVVGFY